MTCPGEVTQSALEREVQPRVPGTLGVSQNAYHSGTNGVYQLDDHLAYLTQIRQDLSQYPHRNVMSCCRLLKQLEDHDMSAKADWVRTVIEKGLNSYALAQKLPANAPVIEPKFFIRVIQKKNGDIIDRQDGKHGEDQNIGLHDLASQLSMRQVNIKQNITVNRHTYLTEVDAGFCLFCNYHCSCHKTLNNHVWLHLWLPMFCGVGDCFYPTFDCKAMVPHVLEAHKELRYLKSKKTTET